MTITFTCLVESSSGSEWEDVEDEDAASVTCLFCQATTLCPEALFKHCSEKHEIDIVKMIKQYGTEFYYIQCMWYACAIDDNTFLVAFKCTNCKCKACHVTHIIGNVLQAWASMNV